MTKAKDRMKEIEHENVMSGGDRDITFLLARVKRLTEALEILKRKDSIRISAASYDRLKIIDQALKGSE